MSILINDTQFATISGFSNISSAIQPSGSIIRFNNTTFMPIISGNTRISGDITVPITNYIGVEDNIHGALRNRALYLDNNARITVDGLQSANSFRFTTAGALIQNVVGETSSLEVKNLASNAGTGDIFKLWNSGSQAVFVVKNSGHIQIGSQQSHRINFLGGASGAAPSNTGSPFGWLDIQISGQSGFKIPVYK